MEAAQALQFLSYVEHFPYPGIFALFVLGSVGLPVPEDAVLVLCGFLISRNVMAPLPAAMVAYAGVLASDFLIFSLGRKYGRRIVTHKKLHRILPPEKFASLEGKFRKYGALLILFGRHLWGFRSQLFLTAGVMGISPRRFLAADALAALITVPFMMIVGYKGGQGLRNFGQGFFRLEHMAAAAAILAAAFLLVRYFRPGQREKME